MPQDPTFVADRFQSTIPYYVLHRLPFPRTLVTEVVRRVGLTKRDRILDLGCGPGTLTIELARCGAGEVVGMDPDIAMLAAAREEAAKVEIELSFVAGSSYDLSPTMGPYKLVTMGRSFHWMDRRPTLEMLDNIVEHGGAVVIFSETPEPALENRWKRVVRDVQHRYGGFPGDGGSRHHATVFLNSPFSQIEVCGVVERLPIGLDGIVGRALSQLESSPDALGDRVGAFERELRVSLRPLSSSGEFSEIIQFAAWICRRPPSS